MNRLLVAFAVAASLLSAPAASERLHDLPVLDAASGPYVAREFTVDLPARQVHLSTHAGDGFLAVDFVDAGVFAATWYSVEWTTLPQPVAQTGAEFHAYWEAFLPRYLSGNFGEGRYALLHAEQGTLQGRPALRYVATGRHNDGRRGSIYGTAIGFGRRMATVYVLRNETPRSFASFDKLRGYAAYRRFVESLRCTTAACE